MTRNPAAAEIADESSRQAVRGFFIGLIGCFAVLATGIGFQVAIPVWFPDDESELAPILTLLIVLTFTTATIGAGLLLAGGRRSRSLAIGLLVGYAVWICLFIPWFLAGP